MTVSSLGRKPHFHPAHAACGIEAFTVAFDHVGEFQTAAQYLMAGAWKPREPYRIDAAEAKVAELEREHQDVLAADTLSHGQADHREEAGPRAPRTRTCLPGVRLSSGDFGSPGTGLRRLNLPNRPSSFARR